MFERFELEAFKRKLAGLPAVERGDAEPVRFVDSGTVCSEFGFNRRTLGRRVKGRIRGEAAPQPAPDALLDPR